MPHGYLPSQCSCAVPVLVSIFTPRITTSKMTLQTSLEFLIYLRTPAGYKHTPYRLFGNPLEIKFYTIALHLMSLIMNTRLGHKLFCDITISLIYIYLPLILYLPLCAIITSFMRASARELLVPYFTPLVYCGHHIQSINLKRMCLAQGPQRSDTGEARTSYPYTGEARTKGSWFEPHRCHCVVVLEQDTFILA